MNMESVIESGCIAIANRIADFILEEVTKKLAECPQPTPNVSVSPNDLNLQQQLSEAQLKIEYLIATVHGEIYKGPMPPIPSEGTCWTCLWFSGKFCQRQGSPKLHKLVLAWEPACNLYKYTNIPRGKAIAKHGEGITNHGVVNRTDYTSEEVQRRRKGFQYSKCTCNKCGKVHTIGANGKLYPHDIFGNSFRLGRGDRTKPCDGVPVQDNERNEA